MTTNSSCLVDWVHTEWGSNIASYLANKAKNDSAIQIECCYIDEVMGIKR